ncbi:MAG: class I SAM-dependent methyltransferase [Gammaproteobacteria bacterium]
MSSERFDAAYFDRYYFARATRIADPGYFDRVSGFLTAYLDLLDCRIESVLDAGCGAGLLHAGLRRAWPQVRIDAFDASAWACREFGWRHATLETFESRRRYDLVICYDVVQYLDREAARAALAKLAGLTRTALFFGVLTREDWRDNCDQARTDGDAHLRSARWYRRELSRHFRNAGGGLYLRRDASEVVLYALESV